MARSVKDFWRRSSKGRPASGLLYFLSIQKRRSPQCIRKLYQKSNGRSYYEISSAGYENGNTCSIRIDGTEYAKNMRGINIVVYNHVTKTVVDSVCFDTHTKGAEAQR